jgi:hypothetical protein
MERKTIKFLTAIVLMTFAFSSCYYDVAADLYPSVECVTDNMSYANDIVPILKDNCLVCHSTAANLGGIDLEAYDQVKIYVESQSLLGSIKHDSGYSAMPQGASKLSVCNIASVEAWISQGAKNN